MEEALKIARALNEKKNANKKEVNTKYAGETVSFELGKRAKPSLDQILSEAKKPKSFNSLSKSTLDWEKYKEENKLEDTLSKNRKDGFIGKANFLLESKQREKEHISSLKRKKLN
ncbi:hypothetical protein SteCoe_31388 [Stentor coeruleus]|uniref:BCNT-C domain-containing protein n=1 Tax=Stentor coeruleus TaxID=5963 RepID=A0A1R2B1D8_9CILI|nr:hypothetical protein SteCoe_31388 [Stentor coeruleus]